MGVDTEDKRKMFSDERLLSFVREHEDPCITAGEAAEVLGVTNDAVNYRLQQLEEEKKVASKVVGASAKVWYVVG